MLQFLVPLMFTLSTVTSLRERPQHHRLSYPTVASESQLKFAIENKYDDTGPGAKQPQYAYNTFKNLEDALVAYLDDPDTKLPEHERMKALNKLVKSSHYHHTTPAFAKLFHKNADFKLFEKHSQYKPLNNEAEVFNLPDTKIFYPEDGKIGIIGVRIDGNDVLGSFHSEKKLEPYRFQKIQTVKGSPLSLAHYTRDPDLTVAYDHYDPHPKYTFSYGVHDKQTGDSKTAQESRDGGTVHGFYSFIDADGKTRTVQYTADDRQGFRANVHKNH